MRSRAARRFTSRSSSCGFFGWAAALVKGPGEEDAEGQIDTGAGQQPIIFAGFSRDRMGDESPHLDENHRGPRDRSDGKSVWADPPVQTGSPGRPKEAWNANAATQAAMIAA